MINFDNLVEDAEALGALNHEKYHTIEFSLTELKGLITTYIERDRAQELYAFVDEDAQTIFTHAQPTPEQGWISVKDRLPPDTKRVFVYVTRLSKVEIDEYSSQFGCFSEYDEDITHWMPLPKEPL